jgi:hypothetical protein
MSNWEIISNTKGIFRFGWLNLFLFKNYYKFRFNSLLILKRKATIVGVSSGALGQFIASPTDLVKIIMQAEGKRQMEGLPRRWL